MTKKVLKKICHGEPIAPDTLTSAEKKEVYACVATYEMPESTCYRRLFEKGFHAWQIKGISAIMREFLGTTPTDDGTRGYPYVLTLNEAYDESKFYDLVTDLRIGAKLCDFMANHGMASQMTVRTRFRANDWKPWELRGIQHILSPLCDEA